MSNDLSVFLIGTYMYLFFVSKNIFVSMNVNTVNEVFMTCIICT